MWNRTIEEYIELIERDYKRIWRHFWFFHLFQDGGGKKEDDEVKNFNAEEPLLDKQDGDNKHSTGNLALYEVRWSMWVGFIEGFFPPK